MTARQDVTLPLWCNGSTVLFGSKSLGSSPGRGAEQRQRIECGIPGSGSRSEVP